MEYYVENKLYAILK